MVRGPGLVVLNSAHSLLPDQERVLRETFGTNWSILSVPNEGWTLSEIRNMYISIANCAPERSFMEEDDLDKGAYHVVFASPVPALLNYVAQLAGRESRLITCWVLHNDQRVAKEIPDGKGGVKIVHSVAPTGWRLA